MPTIFAVLVGCLYAGAIYMMLHRSLFKLILGLVLLSHGTHLLIFTASGPKREQPPIIPTGQQTPVETPADPLAQALILTAIVISFGVMAFALVLIFRLNLAAGRVDTDVLRTVEK
jgi:multicomponent Na+:H+ antiporter subunit C